MGSIKDKNKDYHNNCNGIYEEDIDCYEYINIEDIDIYFELVETINKDEILINFINFYNGMWFSNSIIDEDDIIFYDYRDDLIDAIKNKFGFHIEDPDIKNGIQKTIYDW